ncbi:MAG: hypothetical protein MI864_17700, partial [Pseudomonadales bacterium]|nr:hypothetical protein [Pseudomonadales bacterium]
YQKNAPIIKIEQSIFHKSMVIKSTQSRLTLFRNGARRPYFPDIRAINTKSVQSLATTAR